ncbi:phosphomannomutase/phosphoglucomutase [Thiorhodospira sibirica]|uniref:phosphomannomutase/phosphoglucomutase n=1 Tax=Thiorhodospira sibirica TaxID=154347 RepID=UPI00022C0461|nr:phosphomannomutase/phosphoglucomutase [Thiorhodospira sibirica]
MATSYKPMMQNRLACFKAYDIRGRIPDELNPELAERIARAYARVIAPTGPVAVGEDVRVHSPALAAAVARGLNLEGVPVKRLGLCGTEMVYHAAAQAGMGGGIMVTASHNPADYNGMKLVAAGAVPISGDSGLQAIEALCRSAAFADATSTAVTEALDVMPAYVQKMLSFIAPSRLKPLHLVVNAGHGAAGPAFDAIAAHLPITVTRLAHEPNGQFPLGIPNPLLPENRALTAQAVQAHGADLGIAWDGDFDRCFFFDAHGQFIEGYYLVGLLAEQLLAKAPGAKIVHDPRLYWNTQHKVCQAGGVCVMSKTGHAFIKERMRAEDAVYGGEMSAHHYFRDFAYCDSGMIPWLLLIQAMSEHGRTLASMVAQAQQTYPCSGEINFQVSDIAATLARIEAHYAPQQPRREQLDGLSLEFAQWRFNLRGSNTEPVLRLNVETRQDPALLQQKTDELRALIRNDAHQSD